MSPILMALLVAIVGFGCVAAVTVGLPGTWIFLALAVGIELTDAWWAGPGVTTFGWPVLGVGLGLACIGEALEFASGVWGSKAGGGGRRASVGAFLGGLVGGLAGTFVVPVVGTIMGALLGTFFGAFLGETTGESARQSKDAVKPALTATIGRLLGTVAKLGVSMTVWISVSIAGVWYAWPW